MKKVYSYLICAVSISLVSVNICNAQSATLALKAPPAGVAVDGASQEWGDSLSYYNADKKIHYTIANDKTKLYLVVKTKDPVQQTNIINAGLKFSIDTKGRKKSAYSTTFPTATENSAFAMGGGRGGAGETLQQKSMKAMLTKLKKITVDGFKDINDDNLSTTNPYDIMVAINYDADGNLIYEESIPLELFHAGDLAKGEWSFNIKLNGVESSAPSTSAADIAGPPSGGGGGGGRGGKATTRKTNDASQAFKSDAQGTPTIDFWGKFTLAQ